MRLYVKQWIHHSDTWTLEERDLGFIKNRNVCTKTKFQTKFVWLRVITFRSSLTLSVPYVLSDNTQKSQSFKVVLRSNLHCLEIPSSLNLCQGSLRTWHEYSLSWTFWKEHTLNFVKQPYWEWKKKTTHSTILFNITWSWVSSDYLVRLGFLFCRSFKFNRDHKVHFPILITFHSFSWRYFDNFFIRIAWDSKFWNVTQIIIPFNRLIQAFLAISVSTPSEHWFS